MTCSAPLPACTVAASTSGDPLAAAIALDQSLAHLENLQVRVVEEEGSEIGRTVVTSDGTAARVALSANAQCFEDEFLSRLNGGAKLTVERTPQAAKVTIEVTHTGDACSYKGPKSVPAGKISIDWTVDKGHEGYGFAMLTLDKGKGFGDLDAWGSADKPPWAHEVTYEVADPGTRSTRNVDVQEGPVYIICFTAFPVTKVGTLGPIEVMP